MSYWYPQGYPQMQGQFLQPAQYYGQYYGQQAPYMNSMRMPAPGAGTWQPAQATAAPPTATATIATRSATRYGSIHHATISHAMKLIIDRHQLIVTYDTFAHGAFAKTVLSYTYSNKFIGILTAASYVQISWFYFDRSTTL